MDFSRITNEQLSILLEQEKDGIRLIKLYREMALRLDYYITKDQIPRYDTSKETYKSVK